MAEYVEGDPITGNLVAPKSPSGSDEKTLQIRREKFDSISLYEVTEEELNILEVGESSIELNFAVALFSATLSLVISIFTTTMTNIVLGIFIVCATLFSILGLYFIIKWRKNRGNMKCTFRKIRDRLKD